MGNIWQKIWPGLLVSLGVSFVIFLISKAQKLLKGPGLKIAETVAQTKYKNLIPYIIAQSKVETGDFTSNLFFKQNNLFGMKNAVKRAQRGFAVENTPFRAYESIEDSILDYLDLLEYNNFPKNVKNVREFVTELKQDRYFEEPLTKYLSLMELYV